MKTVALLALGLVSMGLAFPGTARSDNNRLNRSILANVYTIQHQAGCTGNVLMKSQLVQAAEWHANDLMANRDLDGDIGTDGSTVADRARTAGYSGTVAETVALNPALAMSGIEIMRQWYYDAAAMAIMSNCAHTEMGVWSLHSVDRTVVVAVYGAPA